MTGTSSSDEPEDVTPLENSVSKKIPLPKKRRNTAGTDFKKNRKGVGGRPKKCMKLEKIASGDSKQGRLDNWFKNKTTAKHAPQSSLSSGGKQNLESQEEIDLAESHDSEESPKTGFSNKKNSAKSSSGDSGHPDPENKDSSEDSSLDDSQHDYAVFDSGQPEESAQPASDQEEEPAKSSTEALVDQNNNVQHLTLPGPRPDHSNPSSKSIRMEENIRTLENIQDRREANAKADNDEVSSVEEVEGETESHQPKGLGAKDWSEERIGLIPYGEKNRRAMKKFEWLVFSGEGYVCKLCSLFPKLKGTATSFTVRSRPDREGELHDSFNLKRHEVSEEHQNAKKLVANATLASDKELATQRKPCAPTYDDDAIDVMLKMVYFLISKYQSVTTMYAAFHQFLTEELRFETLVNHKMKYHTGYGQYLSNFSVWDFGAALKTSIKEKKINILLSRKVLSILFDESEDAGHREQMSMFARTISPTGDIENHFLDLVQVKDRTALGLYRVVENWCKEHGIKMDDITFCGMDTCNTMSGEQGGVQKYMKLSNPHLIYVPCHNHRVALIFIHMGKKDNFPLVKEFTASLNSFYMYYKISNKSRDTRKDIFAEVQEKCYAPAKAICTRWLSIEPQNRKLVQSFTTEINSLLAVVDDELTKDDKGIRCKALISTFLQPEMIMLQLAFADILPTFQKVQTCIQKHTLVFTQIAPLKLELLEEINQVQSARCFEDCTCGKETCHLGEFQGRFNWAKRTAQGLNFVNHSYTKFTPATFWDETMIPLLQMMKKEVEDGLAFNPILAGLCYLDPRLYDKYTELESYGNEEFRLTVEFYASEQKQKKKGFHPKTSAPKIESIENAMAEFQAAKELIMSFKTSHENERKIKLKLARDQKSKIETEKESASVRKGHELARALKASKKDIEELESDIFDFQALLKKWFSSTTAKGLKDATFLMTMASLVPGSTAIVESSWSVMNLHSDDHSAHLTQEHLNILMHCSLNKDKIDYGRVKQIWANMRKRKGAKITPQDK